MEIELKQIYMCTECDGIKAPCYAGIVSMNPGVGFIEPNCINDFPYEDGPPVWVLCTIKN